MSTTTGAETTGRVGGRPRGDEVDTGFILRGPDVIELFDAAVAGAGDELALCQGDRTLTYAELDHGSRALGARLLETWQGRPGVTAVLLRDRIEIVRTLLAVLRAGGVFVPLDPKSPPARLAQILESLSPDCIVAEAGESVVPQVDGLEAPVVEPGGAPSQAAVKRSDWPILDPTAPRYVYFTSGSTGTPKGIAGTLKGLSHFIRWEIETFGIGPGTRGTQLTVPFFDVFLRDVLVPLCAGGTVCLPPRPETLLDREELAAWMDDEGVELVHCVPTVFAQLARAEGGRLESLRTVLMAGEVLPVSDVRRFRERFGARARLVNLYGSTETTMVKFFHRIADADLERGFVPIGRPMPGAKALVLDANMQVCPPGAVGEIYLRSPFLTLGYLGQPELTAEVFVPNPFSDDPMDRIFRTGDLGRILDDGNFQFLGRRDVQVKIRGVRIEPGEVESALLEHPAVEAAAAVPRDLGESGGTQLVAYVAAPGAAPDLGAALRRHLEERLPSYVVPSAVVVLDELPRLPNGKLDARRLPDPAEAQTEEELIAPRSETESALAEIWAQVLGRPRVFANQDFFQIGGHSLLAAQVLARVRRTLGVDVPLRALFEASTVQALAEHVETLRWMSRPSAAPSGKRQEIEL